MRECPLRWLRPGWVVKVVLSTRTRAEQNYWLVIVVAVDEAKGLACCFLSHHFHTHLLRWMATCQFASGHYGVSFIPSMAMSSSIWKGTAAEVQSLHNRVFRERSWVQEPDTRCVHCKNQYWKSKGLCKVCSAYLRSKYGHSLYFKKRALSAKPDSWSKLHKHFAIKTHLNNCDFFACGHAWMSPLRGSVCVRIARLGSAGQGEPTADIIPRGQVVFLAEKQDIIYKIALRIRIANILHK